MGLFIPHYDRYPAPSEEFAQVGSGEFLFL